MFPNGKSDVHPNAIKVFKDLQRAGDYYHMERVDSENSLDFVIYGCESPIEQMLAVAIVCIKPDFLYVKNQLELVWYKSIRDQTERTFRPDFVIGFDWTHIIPEWEYASRGDWWDGAEDAYPWLPFFAVECDGRDYHNDHEAIERDKQRDRIITTRGMPILRFTGSEIFNNYRGCAEQVVDLFKTKLRERLQPGVAHEELISHGKGRIVVGKKWVD